MSGLAACTPNKCLQGEPCEWNHNRGRGFFASAMKGGGCAYARGRCSSALLCALTLLRFNVHGSVLICLTPHKPLRSHRNAKIYGQATRNINLNLCLVFISTNGVECHVKICRHQTFVQRSNRSRVKVDELILACRFWSIRTNKMRISCVVSSQKALRWWPMNFYMRS